ncbi:hypothetical protein EDB82DRAFT_122670 [Fusarium venenatum]|uniref:uncharacterized protein n=1 Tax=Fusarium venenatum TaxID=56646 RepID=UPI001DC2B9F7|nr:hypothetical protein EDB82DRAFT_122670 [Fusarium venenatum]
MSTGQKDDKEDPKPAKMAAVTVISNPLAKDKVFLFQSGAVSNGLRVVPQSLLDFASKEPLGPKDASSVVRPITKPGQLVSMVFRDSINVYGITGKEQKDYQVELLSPVQSPVDSEGFQPVSGAIAGISNEKEGAEEKAWLYYIWNNNGTPAIGELTISNGPPIHIPLHHDTRWVIYQSTNNEINILNANKNDKKYVFSIDTTDDRAHPGTPLAAVILPSSKQLTDARIVVYFVGTGASKHLYSANSKLAKQLYFDTPNEQPTVVEKENRRSVITTAGLTAIVDEDHKEPRVVVFGLTDINTAEYAFNSFVHPVASITS